MAKTIVGLYDDHDVAKRVVKELQQAGLNEKHIHTSFHEGTTSKLFQGGDLADKLSDRGVPEDEAMLYAEGVRRGGNLVFARVEEDHVKAVSEVMSRHRPVDLDRRHGSWKQRGYTGYQRGSKRFTNEEVRAERGHYEKEESVPVVEEEVKVGKREVGGGGVRVHAHVEEVPVEEQVRLRDEHVEVERRNVDRPVKDADALFEEKTIEMTERDEELVVEKEARVTGEVVVKKEADERVENVRETERHTEVDVERVGNGHALQYETLAKDFKNHCRTTFGQSGGDYDRYEPAYRLGYTYGSDKRYRDRDYQAVEPEIRKRYESDHGKGTFEQVKSAIRHAYDSTRARLAKASH